MEFILYRGFYKNRHLEVKEKESDVTNKFLKNFSIEELKDSNQRYPRRLEI